MTSVPAYETLEFLSLDMAQDYQLTKLTPKSIAQFKKRLLRSQETTTAYMAQKIGFNPNQ
jgi:hypothetical protein